MIIEPTTDLTPFTGARVVIGHKRAARVLTIRHGDQARHEVEALRGGVYGDCVDEPHGDCRGGSSSFWWPYGTDLTVVS